MGGFGPGSSGGFDGAEGSDFGGGLGGPFFGPSTMPGFSPGYGMRPYDMGKNFMYNDMTMGMGLNPFSSIPCLGSRTKMTWTPPVKALEWDILALEAMAVMEALEEATEDLVDMEDLEVSVDLDLHLTVLECPLMALEEDMEELAHTAMVVQVPFTGCQDSEGRGDTMHLLQPMVGSLLLMVLRNLCMALSLLLMMHLLHKLRCHPLMVLSHLHMAPNLLHMAPNLLHMAHNLEVSSNLSSSLLLYLRLDQLDQCNLIV